MKAKKYIVSYGIYNGNGQKDALDCGVFRRPYDTIHEAHDAIMRDIRMAICDFFDRYEEVPSECDIDRIVSSCVWRNSIDSVRFEHGNIEYAYEIDTIEV